MTSPRITREELLAPINRWPWQTKFWLCEGIFRELITFEEAKATHEITDDELSRWYDLYRRGGAPGLQRVNRTHRRRAA